MKLTRSLLMIFAVMFMVSACGGKKASLPETVSMNVDVFMLTAENETGLGEQVGTITITETANGLVFFPLLEGITPGTHGFHVHENPSLAPDMVDGKLVAGMQAGGHYDPEMSGMHLGPYDATGHFGDLPVLYVNDEGMTDFGVLAPRMKSLDEIKGRSVVIYVGSDNYSDVPARLGGGGARMAGALIQ